MQQSPMELLPIIFITLPFVAVLFFGWWMLHWQFRRADELLETWAKDNKLRVVEKKLANFGDGPTGTRQSSKKVKYRITVADEQGQQKRGVISVGSKTIGALGNEVTVEWDK